MATQAQITSLFNQLKEIQQNAEHFDYFSLATIQEVNNIKIEFNTINHKAGIQFCNKVISSIYELLANNTTDNNKKESFLLKALEIINTTVGNGTTYASPTLPKRIARIKSKLSNLLHKTEQHRKANILAKEANIIFYRIRKQFPNYLEIILEQKQHWYQNLKWEIQKEISDLKRLERKVSKDNRTENYKANTSEKIQHLLLIESLIQGCENLKLTYK